MLKMTMSPEKELKLQSHFTYLSNITH